MNSHCYAMICLNNYWRSSISTKRAHQWSNLTKILAISNIIRIFAIAFKRKKAVSKKSITILSCYRNTPNFKKEDGAFMLSLDVYAMGSRLVHILRREICSIDPVPSKVIGVTSITTDMST